MFTNSRHRMHRVSLHNICMAYNMNGCIPISYVCLCLSIIMSLMILLPEYMID